MPTETLELRCKPNKPNIECMFQAGVVPLSASGSETLSELPICTPSSLGPTGSSAEHMQSQPWPPSRSHLTETWKKSSWEPRANGGEAGALFALGLEHINQRGTYCAVVDSAEAAL